jgi:hypothetical protein
MLQPSGLPSAHRYLPRSRPGTGPTSRREGALLAEVARLTARLMEVEQEQLVQFRRISDIQQGLDEMKRLKIAER